MIPADGSVIDLGPSKTQQTLGGISMGKGTPMVASGESIFEFTRLR